MARAADLRDLLEVGVVHFPGSVDKFRNPLIFVRLELTKFLENTSANELKSFFNYFVSISKKDVQENGYVFLLDCTKCNPTSFSDFLELLHDYFTGQINRIYVVQRQTDEGVVGRAYLKVKSLLSNMQGTNDYPRVTLNGYSELERVIDPNQIPSFFDGHLDFDQKLWVETRIELEKLLRDYEEHIDLISEQQETLIKPIPTTIVELTTFEKAIEPLRTNVYVAAQVVCNRAESLIVEETIARTDSPGSSRFRYCPLSIIHTIDSRALQNTFDKLSEVNDNFLNLWGLQLQKVYLEKILISLRMLNAKLSDLESTVLKPLELTLSNTESQFHFYSSIHTTLITDDQKLYECAINAHTCLRDWNYTPALPTDDIHSQVSQLNKLWGDMTQVVNDRRKLLANYNTLKPKLSKHLQNYEKYRKQIDTISVSEDIAENIALPIRHHTLTDSMQHYTGSINKDIAEIDTTQGTVLGNVDVSHVSNVISDVVEKSKTISSLNNQCLAIKEQISLLFSCIKEIQDWLKNVGHPFIASQTLGTNLEESKQGKTTFLKFLANSGLDSTKVRIGQCSKTLNVILNSQFLDDRSVNIIHDTFSRTEVDWKGFGLDVQEHGRDLELSIEFYEAAQNVATWMRHEQETSVTLLTINTEEGDTISDNITKLAKFKQSMHETSGVMDVCHSKYIALSASSNSTLRHIRSAKNTVDTSWTRLSEKVRQAEKILEKRRTEEHNDNAMRPDEGSLKDTSSVGSLDFDNETEHVAFRNTKMLVQELVNTERSYVDDMKDVVVGYKVRVENSTACPVLRANTNTIFGNIEDIYNFHSKIFLGELERSLESNVVGAVFCNNIANFEMYATYCKNKPHSENFLSTTDVTFLTQCQRDLNHVLDLRSYLLKPVQRIMKYHLILEKLLKYAPHRNNNRRDELQDALEIMERVPRYANDVIHLMGLEGYSGDFESLGQLLLQENFLVYINGQRKATPRQIFIFQYALLFSKPVPTKASSRKVSVVQAPKYSYKNHVLLSQVGLTRFLPEDINNVQFEIKLFKKGHAKSSASYKGSGHGNSGETFIIQAATTQIRDQWLDKIEHLLFAQFTNMKNRAASNVL